MIPAKQKAQELLEKYRNHAKYWDCYNDEPLEENHTKYCALILVDEIIDTIREYECQNWNSEILIYWLAVKKYIEKNKQYETKNDD